MDKLIDKLADVLTPTSLVLLLGCVVLSGAVSLLWVALKEERKTGMEAVLASTKAMVESSANITAMRVALESSTQMQERRLEMLQQVSAKVSENGGKTDNVSTVLENFMVEVRRVIDIAARGGK